jgi:hypothetical protein
MAGILSTIPAIVFREHLEEMLRHVPEDQPI